MRNHVEDRVLDAIDKSREKPSPKLPRLEALRDAEARLLAWLKKKGIK